MRAHIMRATLIAAMALCATACANDVSDDATTAGGSPASSKADWGQLPDLDRANQFFLTQIYDAEWNPSGVVDDAQSNNCGPASLAMLMAERDVAPAGLEAEQAIDHARATMYPGYPDIDPSALPEGATLYTDQGLAFVDDDTHPVYFDLTETAPSVTQGITQQGGAPVFGYSWADLATLLTDHGGVIAYGHITDDWRDRFSGDYGEFNAGGVPHFIAVFASSDGGFIVCDPMHKGGAALMGQSDLQSFFKSPVNVYDTTIRLVAWQQEEEAPTEEEEAPIDEEVDPYAMARDVNAHRVTFDVDVTPDSYAGVSPGTGFNLMGTEFWQKWAGGENPTYNFSAGSEVGRRCMQASAVRFEAIMSDPPEGLKDLKSQSNWTGSFFNWNDDYSQSEWGDGQSARLWAWKTGLIKWISQTNTDGSCYLPTLDMVESLSVQCLERANEDNREIVGCKAS
jgi:hypothetical protein